MTARERNGGVKEFLRRLKAGPPWLPMSSCWTAISSGRMTVVLFNTGSGYKYLDVFAKYWGIEAFTAELKLPASRNIGGIIGPY